MKVYLYYYEFNLGYLTYENDLFVWYPKKYQINKAKEVYSFGMDMFMLPGCVTSFEKVPHHFKEYLNASDRADLKKKAGISDSDTEFEKLYKMSKLEYFNEEFYIKDSEE